MLVGARDAPGSYFHKRPSERDALRAEPDGGLSVRDGGADLGSVPDDPRVSEEPIDVGVVEVGDDGRVERCEGPAEGVPLAQDRQPGQPALEPLETQFLEHPVVVADRPPPFLVVVALQFGCRRSPRTSEKLVFSDHEVARRGTVWPDGAKPLAARRPRRTSIEKEPIRRGGAMLVCNGRSLADSPVRRVGAKAPTRPSPGRRLIRSGSRHAVVHQVTRLPRCPAPTRSSRPGEPPDG